MTTQPSHTEQKMRDLGEKFEEDSRHLEDSSTDLADLSGKGVREMAVELLPSIVKDAVNNAVNSKEPAPEPKNPFND